MLKDVIIYGQRIKQRPINMEDLEIIYKNYDEEAAFYMNLYKVGNKEKAVNFIKQCIKELNEETDLNMLILDKETEEFLGYLGIYYIGTIEPELGIWINKEKQHNGYAVEAVKAAITWLKTNYKFTHVKYPVDRKNITSRKIPEYFNGEVKKEYLLHSCNGRELDIVEYWIIN
jgi:RimJ/RimL family protein N-acetyltransferase